MAKNSENNNEKKEVSEDKEKPGWNAIRNSFKKLYPTQEGFCTGPTISFDLGGLDPLDTICVYERKDPLPHWHYVTFGFSELYGKRTQNSEISGHGFELTFRLKKEKQETMPPLWVVNFLQTIARYVFKTNKGFASGHYMTINRPIMPNSNTKITSIAFISDPELQAIKTPNGKVEFLQAVGITSDEDAAMQKWNCLKALEAFSKKMPLFITDLSRDSFLKDAKISKEIEEGIKNNKS